MKCTRCNTTMSKNGKRDNKQRWKCKCGYEKIETDNVLVISDLHLPFEHDKALRFCSDLKNEYKCTTIIQIGDIVDQYCFSRYLRDPDALSTREEIKLARLAVKEWSQEFPEIQITTGNHCRRLRKRLYEIGIPSDIVLKTLNEIFGMPEEWTWHNEVRIDDVTYMHGASSGEFAHINTAKDYRGNVVIGHSHSVLGVDYMTGINDRIWGLNCGCLIDKDKYSFAYAREMYRKPVLGTAVIIDGKFPICIPMN